MVVNLHFLQPLVPPLSAVLLAVMVDMLLRLVPQARDRLDPLLGIPARFAIRFENKLNRSTRGRKTREARGFITLILVILIGLILGAGAAAFADRYEGFEPLFWFLCFRLTFPWTATVELLKVWKHKAASSEGMEILERRRVSVLVPTKNPDRHAVARMLIEATAVSLHNGFLTAVFYGCMAAIFGYSALAAAVFVTVVLEAVRIIVTQENADSPFAQPFQLVEAVLNFVPTRIAALFWALGAFFTPGASPSGALTCMFGYSALAVAVFVTVLLEAIRIIVTQENADSPFAQPFQLVEAVLNFVPTRIAALFWALGAFFTPGASPSGALTCMFGQSDAHRAVNAGWPVAAVAGALNIALPGGKKRDGWIGRSASTARAGEGDVQRVLWLHVVTVTVTVLVLTAILILALAS